MEGRKIVCKLHRKYIRRLQSESSRSRGRLKSRFCENHKFSWHQQVFWKAVRQNSSIPKLKYQSAYARHLRLRTNCRTEFRPQTPLKSSAQSKAKERTKPLAQAWNCGYDYVQPYFFCHFSPPLMGGELTFRLRCPDYAGLSLVSLTLSHEGRGKTYFLTADYND